MLQLSVLIRRRHARPSWSLGVLITILISIFRYGHGHGAVSALSSPDTEGTCSDSKPCSQPGQCCSKWGFCGTGEQHCASQNCKGGACWKANEASGVLAHGAQCGKNAGGMLCKDRTDLSDPSVKDQLCCSNFGFCGTGATYCAPENCQSGNCESSNDKPAPPKDDGSSSGGAGGASSTGGTGGTSGPPASANGEGSDSESSHPPKSNPKQDTPTESTKTTTPVSEQTTPSNKTVVSLVLAPTPLDPGLLEEDPSASLNESSDAAPRSALTFAFLSSMAVVLTALIMD